MKSGKLTNLLLFLIFLALVANLLVPILKAKDALALMSNSDSVPPAVIAAEVSEELAPSRLAAVVADALNNIASSNQSIAAAILEHSRSNENIAYSLDKVASGMRSQRSEE
jgi:hypothetical protein